MIFTEFDILNDAFVFSLRDSCIDFTAHSKYVLMTENKSCKNKWGATAIYYLFLQKLNDQLTIFRGTKQIYLFLWF